MSNLRIVDLIIPEKLSPGGKMHIGSECPNDSCGRISEREINRADALELIRHLSKAFRFSGSITDLLG